MAAVTKNSTEHENDNISITALWILTKVVSELFLHGVVSKLNKNRPVRIGLSSLHPFLKIAEYETGKNLSMESYQLCVTISFLCPRDDSQGALRFAPVCPSDCLSVCPSIYPSIRSFVTLYGIEFV